MHCYEKICAAKFVLSKVVLKSHPTVVSILRLESLFFSSSFFLFCHFTFVLFGDLDSQDTLVGNLEDYSRTLRSKKVIKHVKWRNLLTANYSNYVLQILASSLSILFRCVHLSLQEGMSFCPSVHPFVGPSARRSICP